MRSYEIKLQNEAEDHGDRVSRLHLPFGDSHAIPAYMDGYECF